MTRLYSAHSASLLVAATSGIGNFQFVAAADKHCDTDFTCSATLCFNNFRRFSTIRVIGYLGDWRKQSYQIAKDFRSYSRRGSGGIAGLCDRYRNAEDGRKDKYAGSFVDRNRLS